MKKTNDAILRTGALALAAAGASTQANAATVQITFNNSFISSTLGNHLVTDFGGDGVPDISGAYAYGSSARVGGIVGFVGVGGRVITLSPPGFTSGVAGLAGVGTVREPGSVALIGMVSIAFMDGNVRSGALTQGYLDVSVIANFPGEAGRVSVHRVVFDDATGAAIGGLTVGDAAYPEYVAATVPELSGLGLLTLGAGGLLARRRRTMAA